MQFLWEVIQFADQALYHSLGLLFVVSGILVTVRFVGFPDLTVDGSFTVGAASFVTCIKAGVSLPLSLLATVLSGAAAGLITAVLNQHLRIGKILSSVLVMISLLTIAPYLSQGGSLGLLNERHSLNRLQDFDKELTSKFTASHPSIFTGSLHLLFSLCVGAAAAGGLFLLHRFFTSRPGIRMRYVGSARTPNLVPVKQRRSYVIAGICLGNVLIALGGAVEAQRAGGFHSGMGLGMLVVGLACLVVGETLVRTRVKRDQLKVFERIMAIPLGVLAYQAGLQLLLNLGLTFIDVRLTAAALLLALLAFASLRHPNRESLF